MAAALSDEEEALGAIKLGEHLFHCLLAYGGIVQVSIGKTWRSGESGVGRGRERW